jgi:hypothetical protein
LIYILHLFNSPKKRERPAANKRPRHPRRVGDYSAKVDAIVETLLELQDTHPGEKALLFSQVRQVSKFY